ncbi:MAG TPA: NAD-dependent epimerase/dehydratase family protein [Acidimicrobiales bacterium]|nr:NAD-dependent epimerase/dehydratase family protein [Acidimicrobiales bacterium]
MRLLVLGGTGFVGRHIVEAALDRGHDVTVFNRGRTNPGLFAAVEHLAGDRDAGDLAALDSGEWDAVVDVSAYVPRHVRQAAEHLTGRVGHYTLISTVSVYAPRREPIDESSPVLRLDDPTVETMTAESYGPLKVACEQAAEAAFPEATTVVRPGLVAGPEDPTDRFTYWVRRVALGAGALVGPARVDQPVQVVHARDQGDFVVAVTEARRAGVFNSTGPTEPLTFAGLVAACAEAAGVDVPEVVWVDDDFSRAHRLALPLALPQDGSYDGLFRASNEAARAAGLLNRPIVATARHTLEWDATRDRAVPMAAGPTPEREAELVQSWRDAGRA